MQTPPTDAPRRTPLTSLSDAVYEEHVTVWGLDFPHRCAKRRRDWLPRRGEAQILTLPDASSHASLASLASRASHASHASHSSHASLTTFTSGAP